jgi:hypothetical protein
LLSFGFIAVLCAVADALKEAMGNLGIIIHFAVLSALADALKVIAMGNLGRNLGGNKY